MSKTKVHNRIYIPSFWLNLMMPAYFFIFVVFIPLLFAYFDFMRDKSVPVSSYAIMSALYSIIWIIVYLVLKMFAYSVSIEDDSIRLHGRNESNKYSLNTIKEFNLKTTYYSLAGAGLTKIDFSYVDSDDKIHSIYRSDWGIFLKKRWVKFSDNLMKMTKKEFTLSYFIEGTDGKLYPAKDFYKKQWKNISKTLP